MASSASTKIRSEKPCKIALTLESHKPRNDSEKRENKGHKCDYCEKYVQGKGNLLIHIRTHTGEKPYECSRCPSKFSRKDILVSHTRTHTGEKPYKCEFCNKSFTFAGTWRNHTIIHTGEKPYECQFCDYSCNVKNNIKRHERTHTGEKPYKCVFCSFSSITRCNLKQHEKVHAGYIGSHGLAQYKHRSSRRHVASRAKEHKCPDCPKAYFYRADLIRHKKTHAAKNKYACRFCDYFAIKKRDIAKHELREHTKKAGSCFQSESGSAYTKTLRSLVKQKQVPGVQEQVTTAIFQQFFPESLLRQCRVCGFAAGTDADVALHMSVRHKLPVVTLRRL